MAITRIWGNNADGELGDGSRTNRSSPILISGNPDFLLVSSGYTSSIGVRSNSTLWAWGDNTYGQLGDNSVVSKSSPILVVGNHNFTNIFFTAICRGL